MHAGGAGPGTVVALAVRTTAGGPVREVREASAAAGGWLAGDHGGSGRRGVTLLAREAWEAACREVGRELPWWTRRANVLVAGLDLGALLGRRLRVGELLVEVGGETTPCGVMEQACPGLEAALAPDRRGGVYGRVLVGGAVRVGDRVTALPVEAR